MRRVRRWQWQARLELEPTDRRRDESSQPARTHDGSRGRPVHRLRPRLPCESTRSNGEHATRHPAATCRIRGGRDRAVTSNGTMRRARPTAKGRIGDRWGADSLLSAAGAVAAGIESGREPGPSPGGRVRRDDRGGDRLAVVADRRRPSAPRCAQLAVPVDVGGDGHRSDDVRHRPAVVVRGAGPSRAHAGGWVRRDDHRDRRWLGYRSPSRAAAANARPRRDRVGGDRRSASTRGRDLEDHAGGRGGGGVDSRGAVRSGLRALRHRGHVRRCVPFRVGVQQRRSAP